jgi:hypothetical protein
VIMKRVSQFIIHIILFIYLTSSYLSAIHTDHQALEEHGDCKVCIIIKNLHNSDTPNLHIDDFIYNCYYQAIYFEDILLIDRVEKGFNSNAPPPFS